MSCLEMLSSHLSRYAAGIVALALASPTPASASAPNASTSGVTDSDLKELVGLEHTPFRMDDPVGPDARCRNAGASDLYERPRQMPGWEIGQYNCDDRVVFTLERQIGTPNSSRLRVIDALIVPGATYSSAGSRPHLSWAGPGSGVCSHADRPPSDVIVTLRWDSRNRATARKGIVQAWRFNTQRGRIEPTSTRGIVCEKIPP
jgi:hypothetical protein